MSSYYLTDKEHRLNSAARSHFDIVLEGKFVQTIACNCTLAQMRTHFPAYFGYAVYPQH